MWNSNLVRRAVVAPRMCRPQSRLLWWFAYGRRPLCESAQKSSKIFTAITIWESLYKNKLIYTKGFFGDVQLFMPYACETSFWSAECKMIERLPFVYLGNSPLMTITNSHTIIPFGRRGTVACQCGAVTACWLDCLWVRDTRGRNIYCLMPASTLVITFVVSVSPKDTWKQHVRIQNNSWNLFNTEHKTYQNSKYVAQFVNG